MVNYVEIFLYISILSLLSVFSYYVYFKNNKSSSKKKAYKLPPGSMGWPYIGETLQLYSQDPNVFFVNRQRRYGEIFKTKILGCPCVMLASPEAARFVLVNQANLFKPTYPKSKENLIGQSALFFHQGDYHTHLRKLVQASLNPESIRSQIPHIEELSISALNSWAGGHVVNTYHEMKKARKRLGKILTEIISERKEKKQLEKGLLSCFLNAKEEKGLLVLNDDQIADNIIGVLFAAQDTTASVLTWILKYLHDNQKLLESVKAEQKMISQSNEQENHGLTWTQTRKMPITNKVVLETLRLASIISFTFREAVADVEYKGYLIPKGWKVMPLFRNIHHNPEFFPDPQKFDPSRFENAPKPNTFMPFGSGVHACPGNELAKLEILIMTHHLVTKFRWEVVGSDSGIQYGPFPVPVGGLAARFWKESTTST